jgi:hypothetical protein
VRPCAALINTARGLTKSDGERLRGCSPRSLRELAEAGSPIDTFVADIEDRQADLEISQVGSVHGSTLFELPNGRSGYILDLKIIRAYFINRFGLRADTYR